MMEALGLALSPSRPNVMLTGSPEEAERILRRLRHRLRSPVRDCDCRLNLTLPSPGETLVLRHVGALMLADQVALLEWLDAQDHESQIVSLTETPVFPAVEQGTFLARLFYRLNTIHLSDPG